MSVAGIHPCDSAALSHLPSIGWQSWKAIQCEIQNCNICSIPDGQPLFVLNMIHTDTEPHLYSPSLGPFRKLRIQMPAPVK
jgi:hypothetical protein